MMKNYKTNDKYKMTFKDKPGLNNKILMRF